MGSFTRQEYLQVYGFARTIACQTSFPAHFRAAREIGLLCEDAIGQLDQVSSANWPALPNPFKKEKTHAPR